MILQSLVEFANRRNLVENIELEPISVHFFIRIALDGRFLGLEPAVEEHGIQLQVPRMPRRGNKINPRPFCDNSKYVLGEPASVSRNQKCLKAFVECVAGNSAVVAFYTKFDENLICVLKEKPDWTGGEIIAFVVDGIDGFAHDGVAAHTEEKGGTESRCYITGKLCVPEKIHPVIKHVPGGSTYGTSLVSFNSRSFESHGMSQGENAPISKEAAVAYSTALSWLLEYDEVTKRKYRYGVPLGDNSVMVFWTRSNYEAMDIFSELMNGPTEEDAIRFAESPWRGIQTLRFETDSFYGLAISGNRGRVTVNEAFETTVGEVSANLIRYFSDLSLGENHRHLMIWQLLKAIKADLHPGIGTQILLSALHGRPLPRTLLRLALERLRIPPGKEENADRLLHQRCALIKAVLLRSGKKEVTVSLDETSSKTSYVLGRLFAVLERIQAAAQGDLNASIRDKWFGAASSMPAIAFGRLLPLSIHHMTKLMRDSEKKGYGINLERTKSQVISKLEASPLPMHMGLEDQGLFAIGYYHQRERFFEKNKKTDEEETNDE